MSIALFKIGGPPTSVRICASQVEQTLLNSVIAVIEVILKILTIISPKNTRVVSVIMVT